MERSFKLSLIIFYFLFIFLSAINICKAGINNKDGNILPLSQITPGMEGYGKTVFQGTKIEKFKVKIIGVLKNIRPGTGLILAKIGGNKVIDKAGVIAGMSGSPIYINNKIIGALAFSWAFSKEPIAGITPIEDMLKIFDLKYPTTNINQYYNYYNNEDGPSDLKSDNNLYNNLVPIATPITIDSLSENIIDMFKDDFKKYNLIPMMGGGGSDNSLPVPSKFEPGAAVAVDLVRGDLNLSGIGTVSYVDKNKILIFGHPMFFAGNIDIPFSYAYIHTVLPSLYVSFKLGQATKLAGRLFSDQLTGVAGIIGEKAEMINMDVNLNIFNNKLNYNYEIIKNYKFLPMFIGMSIAKSIEMGGGRLERNTLQFKYDIYFDNGKKITLSNSVASLSVDKSVINSIRFLFGPISSLLINQYKKVNINKIDVKINILKSIKVVTIKDVIVNKKYYKPGDTVIATIELKPWQKKSFFKTIKIKLPYNLKDGMFPLIFSSAQERQFIDFFLSPAKYQPQSFEQLIRLLNSLQPTTKLSVWSILKNRSLVINGEELKNLPSSYYYIYKNSIESSAQKSFVQLIQDYPQDYIIANDKMIKIKIKNNFPGGE